MRLRIQIFLILFTLGVLPIITLVTINLSDHISRHQEAEKQQTEARIKSDFAALNTRIAGLQHILKRIAAIPATISKIKDREITLAASDLPAIQALTLDMLEQNQHIREVQIIDPAGREQLRLLRNHRLEFVPLPPAQLRDLAQAPFFRAIPELTALDFHAVLLHPGAPPSLEEARLLLITPVSPPLGLIVVTIDLEQFFAPYRHAYWLHPNGNLIRAPLPGGQAGVNDRLPAPWPELAPGFAAHQPFLWHGGHDHKISWLPVDFGEHAEPVFWLGVPLEPSGAREWQESLIINITFIVLAVMVTVGIIAILIAAKIDRIKGAILNGLDRILNRQEENVTFHWRGPREVVELADELTALARRYTLNQQAVKEAEAALGQADKMISLGLLVAGVAHEINNPNSIAMLNSAMLNRAWQSILPILEQYHREHGDFLVAGIEYREMREQIPRLLAELETSSRRIKSIVQDLKDYSRQDAGGPLREIDLNQATQAAVRLSRNSIRKATNRFSADYDGSLPPVMGDSRRLEQVLINLLQNSCQALTSPEQAIRLSTAYQPEAGTVSVTVADEGCGMTPETLARITDPFFTTRRENGGTGLGLSVSAGISKEHGGALTFQSTPGQGTIATLTLPVASAQKNLTSPPTER